MHTPIAHRRAAARAQHNRCYYCGFEMWESHAKAFAARHRISRPEARAFRCTAEHLKARQDGGKNDPSNIAAACTFCNGLRHARHAALSVSDYRELVRREVAAGKWHRR